MLARVRTAVRGLILSIAVVGFLLPILIGITLTLWIIEIPRKVGQYFTFEDSIRRVLFYVLDPQELRTFRDDMLYIVEAETEESEEWDRWGLLREIDTAQNEIERRLKDGEFAFTVGGSAVALLIGTVFGFTYAGIVLTIVGLAFSLLVSLRIIITDALCYQSINHRNDPIRHLAVLRGWNRGPVFGTGAVGLALLSVIASQGDSGYHLGTELLEEYVKWKVGGEDRWRVN